MRIGIFRFLMVAVLYAVCCSCASNGVPNYFMYDYRPQVMNDTNVAFRLMIYPERVEYVQKCEDDHEHYFRVVTQTVVAPNPLQHVNCFFYMFRDMNITTEDFAAKARRYTERQNIVYQHMIDGEYSNIAIDSSVFKREEFFKLHQLHKQVQEYGSMLFENYPEAMQTSTQTWEKLSVPAVSYTIDEIIADVNKLTGKRVSVMGFYTECIRRRSLSSIRPNDEKLHPYEKSVWIGSIADVPDAEAIDRLLTETGTKGGWLRIEGTLFSKVLEGRSSAGQHGLWPAGLTAITHAEQVEADGHHLDNSP